MKQNITTINPNNLISFDFLIICTIDAGKLKIP